MKRLFTILSYLMFLTGSAHAQYQLPQLQEGNAVDTSIIPFFYNYYGFCQPGYEVRVQLDPSLIPLASGVELIGIIDIPPGDSVFTSETGFLFTGDTLIFDPQQFTQYTFYTDGPGHTAIDIRITGTPTVANQNYPCMLFVMCTLGLCDNVCNISEPTPWNCFVTPAVYVEEKDVGSISVYPVPASGYININDQSPNRHEIQFRIHDQGGRLIRNWQLSSAIADHTLDLSGLAAGAYYWHAMKANGEHETGKLLIH